MLGYSREFHDVALAGSYVYVTEWGDGLRIINVADPAAAF